MPVQNAIATWIIHDNLRLFLERVSVRIGYRFEDWDWDAIRFGIEDSDVAQDRWYRYDLSGTPCVQLAFAGAGNQERLQVLVDTEHHAAESIEAIARIMQCYKPAIGTRDLDTLIQAAFIDTPIPDPNKIVGCSAVHLAVCPEHQEALAFFGGKHWMTLLREEVPLPHDYAGLEFLTPEARRFFFPAYLARALRDQDAELFENALNRIEQERWTPLQQELIDFAWHLLQGEAS